MHNRLFMALITLLTTAFAANSFGQDKEKNAGSEGTRPRISESNASENPASPSSANKNPVNKPDKEGWRNLLPAKGLGGWEVTDFGGEGKVNWDGKELLLEKGDPLTGINYLKKDFPTTDYEIRFDAKRVEGSDFFCGLTFPVGKEFCSFIAGGWGGGLVGISNLDGFDASENATSTYNDFENDKWYPFRLVVDEEYVRVWIGDEEFVRQERKDHEFSTRIEVYICEPLGYCAFQSKTAVRGLKFRLLKDIPASKNAKVESADAQAAESEEKSSLNDKPSESK